MHTPGPTSNLLNQNFSAPESVQRFCALIQPNRSIVSNSRYNYYLPQISLYLVCWVENSCKVGSNLCFVWHGFNLLADYLIKNVKSKKLSAWFGDRECFSLVVGRRWDNSCEKIEQSEWIESIEIWQQHEIWNAISKEIKKSIFKYKKGPKERLSLGPKEGEFHDVLFLLNASENLCKKKTGGKKKTSDIVKKQSFSGVEDRLECTLASRSVVKRA